MPRHSYRTGDNLICGLWLVANVRGDIRMSRGAPGLAIGERAISVTLKLPLAIFSTPSLSAQITVDAPDPTAHPQIDVQAAADALKAVVGCDVVMTVNDGGS